MDTSAMTFRLAKSTAERIDRIVGNRRRAGFIREAIEAELARRERPGSSD